MIYFNGIKGKNYFEGWFFRICADNFNCAFIPSVSVSNSVKKAYIQLNFDNHSKKLEFDFDRFSATNYEAKIGDNTFSVEGIKFSDEDFSIDVKFGSFTKLKKDIMGCFKFGTPCKHKIISMKHDIVEAHVSYQGKEIILENAVGYIEKDWGKSFPIRYCWLQSNSFKEKSTSFFCSVAKLSLPIVGHICVLLVNGKEFRFATYNFSWIKRLKESEIVFKKRKHKLKINFKSANSHALLAPKKGEMIDIIKEDLNGEISLALYEKGEIIYSGTGKNAGIEWVGL